MNDECILVGVGILNWRRQERIGDRYGSFCLFKDAVSGESIPLVKTEGYGKLVAKVKAVRNSEHIGDLFHGFFPTKPDIGEIIELGEGMIFYDADESGETVGLKPADNRDTLWLNPKMLYRCHSQTVEVYFRKDGNHINEKKVKN